MIISDTMGRTWRNGLTDVALGAAGIDAPILVLCEQPLAPDVLRRYADDEVVARNVLVLAEDHSRIRSPLFSISSQGMTTTPASREY